jgi:hypothetical protein
LLPFGQIVKKTGQNRHWHPKYWSRLDDWVVKELIAAGCFELPAGRTIECAPGLQLTSEGGDDDDEA